MKLIVVFLLGFTLSGVWIALNTFLYGALNKKIKNFWVSAPAISGAIPAVIIYLIAGDHPFHFNALGDLKVWGIAAAAVIISGVISFFAGSKKKMSAKELTQQCLAGAFMEVPQRVMMIPFVILLLNKWGLNTLWSVAITALVWLAGMLFQTVLMTKNFSGKIIVSDMIPSLILSLGIGYAFYATGCFIVPIALHFVERIIAYVGNLGSKEATAVSEKEEVLAA